MKMKLPAYLIRWQLSTPILCWCVDRMLGHGFSILVSTMVANLLGGLIFYKIDEVIFVYWEKAKKVAFRYLLNNALALDQVCNALTGGDAQETVSSRLGKLEEKYDGHLPWWRFLSKFLIWGLDKIDKDHCAEAIQPDEGGDAVCDREEKWGVLIK